MLLRPGSRHARSRMIQLIPALVALALSASIVGSAQVSVTTYHNDNYRTGWNSSESTLTVAAVQSTSFGTLGKVALDDEVDAQPLVVANVTITAGKYAGGVYTVVYVVTENDTVYAIDTATGKVLLNPNFGPTVIGRGCGGFTLDIGITSTPVVDLSSNTLYVMVYTQQASGPAYYLHSLALGSLTDQVAPQLVTASHTLNNGTTFNFEAKYQRQRPALLLANGNVYAGFGSFCDYAPAHSRGWLLGWQTGTLTPLAGNQLTDTLSTSPDTFFLSSIWMSGYGLASDDSGDVLFVTANSDPSGTTYDGVNNIQESVVEVSSDLTTVLDLFTPSDVGTLDQEDLDFGSGGVMVLPDQESSTPHLAVAAGKTGTMFFMNEDDLGGYSALNNDVLGAYPIGGCWCGESYFVDPVDGVARVVSSGGQVVTVWEVELSASPPMLMSVTSSSALETAASSGFFTSVSSNGNANAIIWAVSRPNLKQTTIYLYAFAPDSSSGSTMEQIYKGTAGTWELHANNANLIPVVANGEVFVASYKELVIFGLRKAAKAEAPKAQLGSALSPLPKIGYRRETHATLLFDPGSI